MIPFPEVPTLYPDEILAECRKSPNALESWFMAVEKLGLRTPKTHLFELPASLQMELMDGFPLSEESKDYFKTLSEQIKVLGDELGFPLFIRTSFTSAKHYWKESCSLADADPATLYDHIEELLMYQSLSPHLLTPSLVVREMIETKPVFTAFDGKMPITQEFRVFANSGKVAGYQPYWPKESIEDPSIEGWADQLETIARPTPSQLDEMIRTSEAVTKELGGYWSVDFLVDKNDNLWLIDMADGNMSYKNEIEFVSLRSARKRQENNHEISI